MTHPQDTTPANPAQVTDAMVEVLAEFLCSEFDEDFNPCHGYSWPEHKDDDGYRGGNAYVKLQPSDVQARAREGATRILTFLSQCSALTAAIGAGGQAVADEISPYEWLAQEFERLAILRKMWTADEVAATIRRHDIERSAIAHPVQPGWRESLLDKLAEHKNFELSWGAHPDDDTEACWQVHRVNGGRNDREWTLIGVGNTPHEALYAALRTAPQPKGE